LYWSLLGQILLMQERTDEAASALAKAIELDPDVGWPWQRLGEAYGDLGREEDATEAFEQALEIFQRELVDEPESARLRNEMAWLIATEPTVRSPERLNRALELAREAVELTGHENSAMMDTLAEVLFQRREVEAALDLMERANAVRGLDSDYVDRQLERFRARAFETSPDM